METTTPYELINRLKPDLSHIAPFGTICYATLPPEKRDGKLADTGFRGRLVGYGDDDGLEEVKGYHIPREADQSLHWVSRRNTKFDLNAEITNIPGTTNEELYDEGDDIYGDPYYSSNDGDVPENNDTSEDEPSGTTINENAENIIEQDEIEAQIPPTDNLPQQLTKMLKISLSKKKLKLKFLQPITCLNITQIQDPVAWL
jgi:hypothetical protein